MSVIGFQKKNLDRGWVGRRGKFYQVILDFGIFLTLQSP